MHIAQVYLAKTISFLIPESYPEECYMTRQRGCPTGMLRYQFFPNYSMLFQISRQGKSIELRMSQNHSHGGLIK